MQSTRNWRYFAFGRNENFCFIVGWDHGENGTELLKKAGFVKQDDEALAADDPFNNLKASLSQLSVRDKSLNDISPNEIMSFDNEVTVSQDVMTDE